MYREALRGRGKFRIINNVENNERMGLPIKINLVNRGFDHDHGLEEMKIVVRNWNINNVRNASRITNGLPGHSRIKIAEWIFSREMVTFENFQKIGHFASIRN